MLKNLFKSLTALLICTMFTQNVVFMDAAEPWQLGFQDPATPIMEGIINFHNHIMFFLTAIGVMVFWLLARGYGILVVGYWLIVFWLLANGY